jgi:hypothetical protein
MPDINAIDERLTAVEHELSQLKVRVAGNGAPDQWLERFIGAFENDQAFDEAAQLAREYRQAQTPESNG